MTAGINPRIAALELAIRKTWALSRIVELINAGRADGWLPAGNEFDCVSSRDVLNCDAQLGEIDTPMRRLAKGCGLESRDMEALWLLATIELEPSITRALSTLVPAGAAPELSMQLLERAVFGEHVSRHASATMSRLRDLGLIELSSDPSIPLQRRLVRVADRVLDLARGELALDPALSQLARVTMTTRRERDPHPAASSAISTKARVLLVISGSSESTRMDCANEIVAAMGKTMLRVDARALSEDQATATRQLRGIGRECLLHKCVVVLQEIDHLADRIDLVEDALLTLLDCPVVATAGRPIQALSTTPVISVNATIPEADARSAYWRRALPNAEARVIEHCASTLALSLSSIESVATVVRCASNEAPPSIDDVKAALRVELDSKLASVARRVTVTQTWDDLVLSVEEFDLLLELCSRVRHRDQVLTDWGFATKVGRGTGVTALMSGPPGTGKTMIAGLIANELGLDLYQIDLSKIVSKYLGETEKQLATVFDAADAGHAVLLFDEADSLFGKRTEVKSSNDRYANLETNFLLQRIELFTGIAILTTNHESAIDPAFKRRLTTHIRVPSPERAQREELWKAMMPEKAAVSGDLDFSRLANEFEMTGGYIKNATLRAAFLAAAERKPISTAHLLRAARAEYQSMGRIALG